MASFLEMTGALFLVPVFLRSSTAAENIRPSELYAHADHPLHPKKKSWLFLNAGNKFYLQDDQKISFCRKIGSKSLCSVFLFFLWQTVCVARRIEFSELEPVMVQKEILVLLQCIKIGLDYR